MGPDTQLWVVIAALAVGSYALRFSFIGFYANRDMPLWLLRPLRYAGVAIIPGLVAPLVLWPEATGGETDPVRLSAAVATFVSGYVTGNVIVAMLTGAAFLYGLPFVLSY
ncbi:AzlD domain-containing protein [Ponticoccus sp. SC2-23]|uniref:AzlD domain-containing protein n=1 Tax=Alexandriicola marinus TaxID=2081710 RepID=UPI000FD8E0C0|nr:AzlD domain-containing protein [Alexandriicola marinus]MBM1220365.1 AzlD domain-containing protein [Ponticoccus sp. SC6-9]MBM1225051.1 AzlD domain-containing protein [Ponticoccus sp. SC6-15]MBM1228565.1 AzlD domain-containing protein [Ponticoccus sp. SC6-38]MBM1233798.1 AzlD domain-containing protein [Ponticoccus sp. SC6-45]MBM1239066.1 AzlD domain-containing protein [Ponticoccus sp. SC6-49]MBM1242848.1 AzlD domain-containing protein [Ponticoccus sp. SC2-64]MBM1247322.1 AzlD domain-contai